MGVGPRPSPEELDPNLTDAGKQPITALPGASYFDSSQAFGMIRGRHIDVAVLGALQVSEKGDLANWAVPGSDVLGVGGAMDLAAGARRVIVAMMHTDSSGASKLVPSCSFPLTARARVSTVVTELAVFDVRPSGLVLKDLQPGIDLAEVRARTAVTFGVEWE